MEQRVDTIVDWLKKKFESCDKRVAVLGVSGGIDSAVVLHLCVKALGSERVVAVVMPGSTWQDEDGDLYFKTIITCNYYYCWQDGSDVVTGTLYVP